MPGQLATALADRYTIERELGRGGMATVYLAEDLRHHRLVALKVFRPELAAALGPERFLREIAVTAQLHHPHILPLYDSGEAAGLLYYVMPYVEGECLRDRLQREEQLSLPDALQVTQEVADALAYAHSRGVVHRDIKPENILLENGHAVVADFGIARAVSAAGDATLTGTGIAIGTPVYMSPEQASGSRHVDGRSDLYSLGCVLYEMLSGEPPYGGRTAEAILAKKLSEPLPRISVVRETVPAGVEAALRKALARTPADRFATAAEFAAALINPEATGAAGKVATGTRATIVYLPRWVPWAAGVVGAAAIALVGAKFLKPGPLGITVSDITPVTSDPGVEFQPAISPDGKELAYVAGAIGTPHLVIRSTAGTSSGGEIRLADTTFISERFPSWTGDGESVRFWGCRASGCAMYEIGKLGGTVGLVNMPSRTGIDASRTAWSQDGGHVAYVADDTIFAASTADTVIRIVVVDTMGRFGELHSPSWSPDGRLIAYVIANQAWPQGPNVAQSSIWIVSAAGGVPHRVTSADHLNVSPAWLDARHLLFVSDRDGPRAVYIVEVGAEGSRGEARVLPGVADPHSVSYSVAAQALVFSKFVVRQNIWAYPLGRSAPISIRDGRPVTTGTHQIESHDESPDGKSIAFNDSRRGEDASLFRVSSTGGEVVPLTDLPDFSEAPRWSHDGREIAFNLSRPGSYRIMVMPADGGTPVAITDTLDFNGYPQWSPNGLHIAYKSSRTGRAEVYVVSRDSEGGPWHPPVRITDFGCFVSAWAQDGSILCRAHSSPKLVSVSPQGRILWQRDPVSGSGLSGVTYFAFPHFSRDGKTIYSAATQRDGRRGIWAIPVAGGPVRLVVAYDDPALNGMGFLSLGPDRLYLTVAEYDSDIWVAKLRW